MLEHFDADVETQVTMMKGIASDVQREDTDRPTNDQRISSISIARFLVTYVLTNFSRFPLPAKAMNSSLGKLAFVGKAALRSLSSPTHILAF